MKQQWHVNTLEEEDNRLKDGIMTQTEKYLGLLRITILNDFQSEIIVGCVCMGE